MWSNFCRYTFFYWILFDFVIPQLSLLGSDIQCTALLHRFQRSLFWSPFHIPSFRKPEQLMKFFHLLLMTDKNFMSSVFFKLEGCFSPLKLSYYKLEGCFSPLKLSYFKLEGWFSPLKLSYFKLEGCFSPLKLSYFLSSQYKRPCTKNIYFEINFSSKLLMVLTVCSPF